MAKDQKKQPRPRAETPKGFRDYFGADVTERKAMLDAIAKVYELHGFDPLETSAVETVEALGKFLPDVDRPNAGVFAWQEEAVPGGGSGDWLALRYDLTAPLARVAAQFRNDLPSPYRRYAMGPVWRNEKPGPGRFRQFYQCDADTVGSASVPADAEICAMLADALEAVGIARGDYLVRINNRKVLNGVLEAAEVRADQAEDVLRQIDKFDKVGRDGSMPNSAVRSAAEDRATNWAAGSVTTLPIQSRAVRALVIVSMVVKVFDATITSVVAGSSPFSVSAMSAPSTLLTKWARGPS